MKKYLIAIPCMDMIATPTVASLVAMKRVDASRYSFLANSLVYDARNMLMEEALETGADRVLFIDSDMCFKPDLMERLASDMDEHNIDFVTGLYFKRRFPTVPAIYKEVSIVEDKGKTELYEDYPRDSIFEIEGCGFGSVMVSANLLESLSVAYGKPFLPYPGMLGEDLSFCYRVKKLGAKMYCDSSITVGHVGQFIYSEQEYIAQREYQK